MPHGMVIVLIGALFLFSMYRRVRRTIGYQKLTKGRMIIRIVLFSIICVLFLITGYLNPSVYIFDALGILIGGVIAYFAIRTTSFDGAKMHGIIVRTLGLALFCLYCLLVGLATDFIRITH